MLAEIIRLSVCSLCWAAIIVIAIPTAVLLVAVLFFLIAMDIVNESL